MTYAISSWPESVVASVFIRILHRIDYIKPSLNGRF